jgi:hypothetical protein
MKREECVTLRIYARMLLAMVLALTVAVGIDRHEVLGLESQTQPYVRPEFAAQMQELRPIIIRAAQRHNRPELSLMTDREFAAVIAKILYNEHNGWLEDAIPPFRAFTPAYQASQDLLNGATGTNLTVWPANLRPSVALEILRGELPLPGPGSTGSVHVRVAGSHIQPHSYTDQRALYAAINAEISRPDLAVEYLAANLQRGLYRARAEGTPVTWQALAAWHNQGVVRPSDIERSPAASHYITRAAAYQELAVALVAGG